MPEPLDRDRLRSLHRADPGYQPFHADDRTVAQRFWEQVARRPRAAAILGDDGTHSYAALARLVRIAAAAISPHARDATGSCQAGILLDHGVPMIATILGALTAGVTYVPLDPSYPVHRLAAAIADADADVIVTAPRHVPTAQALLAAAGRAAHVVDVTAVADPGWVTVAAGSLDGPAYLLYTSGSTGRPKGVAQTHRNLLFQLAHHVDALGIGPGDRLSVLSSFAFDMAVTDTFAALTCGAAAVPIDVRRHGLRHLATALQERGVTVYHSTPTVYRYLTETLDGVRLDAVRAVLLGGEEVITDDLARFLRSFGSDAVFINGYGATEISFAAQEHLGRADAEALVAAGATAVPIGRPLPGIDIRLRPTPETVSDTGSGEIVLRSRYLASYWRDARSNAARFAGTADGRGDYATGDLGRWDTTGRLSYLGRIDRQVKIRGHRVELGEVEAVLAAHDAVAQAVVLIRDTVTATGPERWLAGYVLPAKGTPLDVSALRAWAAGLLPAYAVPAEFAIVEDWPLTATGKVDTAALPCTAARAEVPAAAPERPGPGTEALIVSAWCAVLGVSDVDRHTPFFDIGGHSLLLAQIQLRLESALHRTVPLVDLLAYPTVVGLAAHLDGLAQEGGSSAVAQRMARRRSARSARPHRSAPPQPHPDGQPTTAPHADRSRDV